MTDVVTQTTDENQNVSTDLAGGDGCVDGDGDDEVVVVQTWFDRARKKKVSDVATQGGTCCQGFYIFLSAH